MEMVIRLCAKCYLPPWCECADPPHDWREVVVKEA